MSAELELEQRLAEISEELTTLVGEVGQHLAEQGDRTDEHHAGMCRALEAMGGQIASALQKTGGEALVESIVNGLRHALSVHPPINVDAQVNVSSAVVKVAQQNVELAVTVKPNVAVQPVFKVPESLAPQVHIHPAKGWDADHEYDQRGRIVRTKFRRVD